jgi:hypothetical protein
MNKMVVSRAWANYTKGKKWNPPMESGSVIIILGWEEHIAVTWTQELKVWHLHNIIKEQFGYLDRNKMCLSVLREKKVDGMKKTQKIILGFEENPQPNEMLYFSYWPVESWDRSTLVRIKLGSWKYVDVPPNYTDDDVWAAIATMDPLALSNRMSLNKENGRYWVSWNPMSRAEWLSLYG